MSKLFEEFEGVSAKAWKQKIQMDLKGAGYNETLVWQFPEGIHVKPFYHPDDFQKEFIPVPGHPKDWQVMQLVHVDDVVIANNLALFAMERGAEAIFFTANKVFDHNVLFDGLDLSTCGLYFRFDFLQEDFLNSLVSFLKGKNAKAFYNVDLIGNLAKTGNW